MTDAQVQKPSGRRSWRAGKRHSFLFFTVFWIWNLFVRSCILLKDDIKLRFLRSLVLKMCKFIVTYSLFQKTFFIPNEQNCWKWSCPWWTRLPWNNPKLPHFNWSKRYTWNTAAKANSIFQGSPQLWRQSWQCWGQSHSWRKLDKKKKQFQVSQYIWFWCKCGGLLHVNV